MSAVAWFAVVCLLWPAAEGDLFDDMYPVLKSRIKDIREVLLPIPEDTLQEALYHAGSYLIPLDSETELCRNHSNLMFESFLNFDLWALRMVDASSKLPSGVLDGHFLDIGSYDQCLSVEAPGKIFSGQMCIVETRGFIPSIIDKLNPEKPFLKTIRQDLLFSICVPSSCTPQDVKAHLDVAFNSVNASAIISESSCSSKVSAPLNVKEWIVILLIALIVILVILSTVYENFSLESEKNNLLCAFSLVTNVRQMLSTETTPAALTCLNGLRVLAMIWVIMGHRILQMISFPNMRSKTIIERIDEPVMALLENAQLSVEIFFLMSGTLVAYGYLRYMKKGHKFNLFYFYLYRYFRLTPALAVIVLLYATIAIRFTDGPIWLKFYEMLNSSCNYNWWATLLFINNYYDPYRMCVTQSWFLASDFQLYVFSPVLLIPLHKKPKVGFILIVLFVIITTSGSLWNAIVNNLKGGGAFTFDRRSEDTFAKEYIVTHWRATSFLVGLGLGYVFFKVKEGELVLKLSRAKLWAGWLLSIFFIAFSVFFISVLQNPEYVPNRWVDIPYMVFHRHFFIAGVSWIILVCILDHGGYLNQFLSWNILTPFTRLTYGAFLTHVLIQSIETYSQRTPGSLKLMNFWFHVAADFTLSYLAGAVLYLTVEGPCGNIAAHCFEGKMKSKEVPENQATELPVINQT